MPVGHDKESKQCFRKQRPKLTYNILIYFICVHMSAHTVMSYMWRTEGNLSYFSPPPFGPQVVWLGGRYLHLLSHLTSLT